MISVEKFFNAADLIKDKIMRTPLVHSPSFSRMFGGEVYLKLENLQKTGSFKIRGATHSILSRRAAIGPRGVVTASAGNHAQGVALAARLAGVPATVVMPEWASITKQEATRSYGGEVVIAGQSIGESLGIARDMVREGKTFVHPFDDPEIISGQGTVALEVLGDLPDTAVILVPVGGGGLISGVAAAAKSVRPEIRVVGVQAAACPSALESRRSGAPVRVEAAQSIADGISVKQIGELNFEFIEKYVDDLALVEEEQIATAILLLLERKKTLAEGAGAAPLAALLNGSVTIPRGAKVVLLISGGNVDSPLLGRILSQGLVKNGRIMRFRVRLDDRPGALAGLLQNISGLKANVLHILHDRNVPGLPMYITRVELEVETRGSGHVEEIFNSLKNSGYEIEIN